MTERSGWPRRVAVWSLALTAACLPLYVVRWHLGLLPTTVLENLIFVTFAAYAATLWKERRLPAARTWLDIPIALLLVAGIIGIVVAPDHTRAIGIYRAYFVEAIAMYYIAVDLIRTRDELRTVLLIAAVGMTLFATGQIGKFLIALAEHNLQVDNGPAFLNTSANQVALFLEPPLAFAAGFVLYASGARDRWLASASLALLLVATILTLSRASYLALVVLAMMILFYLPNRRWRMGAAGAISLIVLAVALLPFINQRLGTLGHSVMLRSSIYEQSLRMLSQRPIFGAGISGFPIRVAPFRPGAQEIELYPHNIWLTMWSETGLLGLISFAAIFFGLLWRGWRALGRSTGIYRAVIWGATGGLVMTFVHGMFDEPYWKNDLSIEFWLMAALLVIGIRSASQSLTAADGDHRPLSSS